MFKKPFSFDGRIARVEYLLSFILFAGLFFIINSMIEAGSESAATAGFLFIPLFWFIYAQGAKRCHDTGRNGWWQLIPLFWIILIIAKGDVRDK